MILKSWYSVIVSDGVWILNSPTPALATAGSGDCLAGICAAVLARGGQIPAAALIHNAAGHRAGMLYGRDSVTAEDISAVFTLTDRPCRMQKRAVSAQQNYEKLKKHLRLQVLFFWVV